MPIRRGTVVAMLVVGGGLVVILIAFWGRPSWSTVPVLLALAALTAGYLILRQARQRDFAPRSSPAFSVPAPAPPPARPHELRLSAVRVPSDTADYDFLLSATVRWAVYEPAQAGMLGNQAGAACEAIVQRARLVTQHRSPAGASFVEQELGGRLGGLERDRSGQLLVMADNIELVLSRGDQERLDRLAEMRKDEEVWKYEWRWEQTRRQYLADDVLKDIGSTVVWWLARNDHHVERTVGDLHQLARLSAAANNHDLPDWFRQLAFPPAPEPLPQADDPDGDDDPEAHHLNAIPFQRTPDTAVSHLDSLLDAAGLTDDAQLRRMLADQIIDLFDEYQLADFAQKLRPTPPSGVPGEPAPERQPAVQESDQSTASPERDADESLGTETDTDTDTDRSAGLSAEDDASSPPAGWRPLTTPDGG
ncbi:hypothetical protein UG55_108535 [Frankia sp. EI5c]|nr:hypothetical protein UG55_108535 [Frankia sp. EI5c]